MNDYQYFKPLFKKFRPEILAFCNTDFGKEWLADSFGQKIDKKEKIIKVAPAGFHVLKDFYRNQAVVQSTFYPCSPYIKKFDRILQSLKIAQENGFLNSIKKEIYDKPNSLCFHPWVMFSSSTFNPTTGTGGPDGACWWSLNLGAQTWATYRGTSSASIQATSSNWVIDICSTSSSNNWGEWYRAAVSFDTSSLTSAATISNGVFSYYGNTKTDDVTPISPALSLVDWSPATNYNFANTDFNISGKIGTTQQATNLTFASLSTAGYNDFTLNATGKGNVSKTGVTKFACIWDIDRTNTPFTWQSNKRIDTQGNGGNAVSNKLKLVITYTVAASKIPSLTLLGIS